MFDDPNKALRRLEEELWEVEDSGETEANGAPEAPEDFSLDGLWHYEDEDEELLQDVKTLLGGDTPPVRQRPQKRRPPNDAVNFHRTVYADEQVKENSAVYVEKEKKKKQGGGGCGCLPVIVLLELAGIAGLAWWWFRWLR